MDTRTGTYSLALTTAQAESGNPREQWIHLLPAGTFAARDGRGPWSAADPAAIIEQSRRYAGTRLIPVDYEHQTDHAPDNGQPAPAAGWIKALQARPDGIWGLVEWTAPALASLDAREYRYLSPVFSHTPDGAVIRILRAALTNNPALDQLTALARAGNTMQTLQTDQILSQLRQALGLAPEADFPAILEKIRAMATPADPAACAASTDPSQFVPIGTFRQTAAELQALRSRNEEQETTRAVDAAIDGGHMLPGWRPWALALCRQDRAAFDGFVRDVSPFFAGLRGSQTGGKPPETRGAYTQARVEDEELSICRALGHSPEDFKKYGGQ